MVNNTAAVAVAIPVVLELTRNLGMSATKFLMPLSFIGMLGGMITLIGTSTNILAATVLADLPEFGRQPGMFEFAPVGLLVLVTGLAYFLVAGRFLLPDTDLGGTTDDSDDADDEEFVVELRVPAGSRWVGESLAGSGRAASVGVRSCA
jgi:di/tricarboxylate transporter